MPFFDEVIGTFDKAVGTVAMAAEDSRQTRQRERIAKNLEDLSLLSKVTSVGSAALALLGAFLLVSSGAGFAIAGGVFVAAAVCSAFVSYDLGDVAEKGNRMLTNEGAYGKALRSTKIELVDDLFKETLLLKKLLSAKIKSDLAHDLIRA